MCASLYSRRIFQSAGPWIEARPIDFSASWEAEGRKRGWSSRQGQHVCCPNGQRVIWRLMVDADIRGKLAVDACRAHDRAEDLFTSTVFGLLRYLPARRGIIALLERARPAMLFDGRAKVCAGSTETAVWIDLSTAQCFETEFWPSFGRHGQPDVLIRLLDTHGRCIHTVVIEAKLFSAKSGGWGDSDKEDDTAPDPDQLFKYWQGLHSGCHAENAGKKSVLYLTSHSVPPVAELGESLRRAQAYQPPIRLAWLNWRDVWQIASDCARQDAGMLAAQDLARLLAHRGFKFFDGFTTYRGDPLTFPPARIVGWFSLANATKSYEALRFWRQK